MYNLMRNELAPEDMVGPRDGRLDEVSEHV